MDKAQKGFTLIELVVVITILGILAAFAFPRFAALETEAREATVEGLAGSVRSAMVLAHSLELVGAATTMEGNAIVMANGYPDSLTIPLTLVDYTGFQFDDDTPIAGTSRFSKLGASTPATCSVEYTEAAGGGAPATLLVSLGGC